MNYTMWLQEFIKQHKITSWCILKYSLEHILMTRIIEDDNLAICQPIHTSENGFIVDTKTLDIVSCLKAHTTVVHTQHLHLYPLIKSNFKNFRIPKICTILLKS